MDCTVVGMAINRRASAGGGGTANPARMVGRRPAPAAAAPASTLESIVEIRAAELARYQSDGLARRFRALVARAADAENGVLPGSTELAEAVARAFHKLLAYNDEYEVARLPAETRLPPP